MSPTSPPFSRKLIFSCEKLEKPKTVLLIFNAYEAPEFSPIVWSVIDFPQGTIYVAPSITYDSQLEFFVSGQKDGLVTSPTHSVLIQPGEETTLESDGKSLRFSEPGWISPPTKCVKARNRTGPGKTYSMSLGFGKGGAIAQTSFWAIVPDGCDAEITFNPILRAYLVDTGRYKANQIIKQPFSMEPALEENVAELDEETSFTVVGNSIVKDKK